MEFGQNFLICRSKKGIIIRLTESLMEVQDEGKTNFVGSNHRCFREESGTHSLRREKLITCLCRDMLLKG
jgi:hypothetical protein